MNKCITAVGASNQSGQSIAVYMSNLAPEVQAECINAKWLASSNTILACHGIKVNGYDLRGATLHFVSLPPFSILVNS